MSEEIFVQAFDNGESQRILTREILRCFEGYIQKTDHNSIDLVFSPTDFTTVYFEHTEPRTDHLMIAHPCADARLAECVFRVMHLGNCILFSPGGHPPMVVTREAIPHFPLSMLKSLGEPRVASNLEEFVSIFLNV